MSVYIENDSGYHFPFHYKVLITRAVNAVMKEKNIPEELDVNVMIISPEEMQKINREARGIDQVTDVLSFPYFEYETPGYFDREIIDWTDGDILGDLVICADKVVRQAEDYGHSQKRELVFLTVHSMLHLVGYDHIEKKDADLMEPEQDRLMDLIGISR